MKYKDAKILYNPGTDQIEVMPAAKVETPEQRGYERWHRLGKQSPGDAVPYSLYARAMAFIDLWHIVYRDRVDVDAAHEAFMCIDEFRDGLAGDVKGTRRPELGAWDGIDRPHYR